MNEGDLMPMLILNLQRDEGFMDKPYRDTVGKLTIGYGRNLDDVGITKAEARVMLINDIETAMAEAIRLWPWIRKKPVAVRLGFYNMIFNMGAPRVLGFKKMLERLEVDDYQAAADEALDSKWAKQVGERAVRIADLFRSAA